MLSSIVCAVFLSLTRTPPSFYLTHDASGPPFPYLSLPPPPPGSCKLICSFGYCTLRPTSPSSLVPWPGLLLNAVRYHRLHELSPLPPPFTPPPPLPLPLAAPCVPSLARAATVIVHGPRSRPPCCCPSRACNIRQVLSPDVVGGLVDVLRFRMEACDPAAGAHHVLEESVEQIGQCLSTLVTVLVGHTTGERPGGTTWHVIYGAWAVLPGLWAPLAPPAARTAPSRTGPITRTGT